MAFVYKLLFLLLAANSPSHELTSFGATNLAAGPKAPAPGPKSPAPAPGPKAPAPGPKAPVPAPGPKAPAPPLPPPGLQPPSENQKGSSSGGMSGGKKAGITIGVLAAAGVVGFGGLVYKKRNDNMRRSRYGSAARASYI